VRFRCASARGAHTHALPGGRSTGALGRMTTWRTWLWMIALAALGPALLWASPWGPARTLGDAVWWFVVGYPAWLILSVVWLAPGIVLARRFALSLFWVVPVSAVTIQLLWDGISHWPPSRWWLPFHPGPGRPIPGGYLFGYPIEAWHDYLYSLWPRSFLALIAAACLVAIRSIRPNSRWSGP
jgi:hypothetical protein